MTSHPVSRWTRTRRRLAYRLRILADRIDHHGAPKRTHVRFTFETGQGMAFRTDGRGCPVWYLGDDDYDRAHDEAGPVQPGSEVAYLTTRRTSD